MFNAYIDRKGKLQSRFQELHQYDSYIFILCTQGGCRVNLFTTEYQLKENSMITLLPLKSFEIIEQRPDTELYVVSFRERNFASTDVFETIIEYIADIIEHPIIEFEPRSVELIQDYIKVLLAIKNEFAMGENSDFANTILKQILIVIRARYQSSIENALRTDHSRAMVMRFVKLITQNYQSERGLNFYAQKMNISPQHLSTVVKKVTKTTVTEIIAMFVVIHAQTKLSSTDLSVSEIAVELNFEDLSSFSRYFKRYTNLSPRKYRVR